MIRNLFIIIGLFYLINCGGGGGSGDDSNNVPTAVIKADGSAIEGTSVELDASDSTDSDNDILTYKWVQLSGKTVLLINQDTEKPSFIAPDVDEDSKVTFELQVNDGKAEQPSIATVEVNIINQIQEEKRQEVLPNTSIVDITNGTANIVYTYSKNPSTEPSSGLALNIYWDSSKLEYSQIKDILELDYVGVSEIKEDKDDADSSESTDSYVTISWLNLKDGNWQVPEPMPTILFNLEMNQKTGATGTTYININSKFNSPDLGFYSKSVIVKFAE